MTDRDTPETDQKIDERFEAGYDVGYAAALKGHKPTSHHADNKDWAAGYRRGYSNI